MKMKTLTNTDSELTLKNFQLILKCIDSKFINYMLAIC